MRSPSFMAIDEIEAFDRALDEVSIEAAGAALKLMVKTFIRGKAFADDEAAARALHMQARRLCRVKDQFDEFFGFASELVRKARQRFECRTKSELNSNLRPKNSAKSAAAAQMEKEVAPRRAPSFSEPSSKNTGPPPSQNHREEAEGARPKPPDRKPAAGRHQPRVRKRQRRFVTHKTPITGWSLGPPDHAFAQENGFNGLRFQRLAEEFYNHHLARASRFADWAAAWRQWVLVATQFAARDAEIAARRQPASIVRAWAHIEAFKQSGLRTQFG
jgi:uncharacterized protein YdaU (DUF1376 family)